MRLCIAVRSVAFGRLLAVKPCMNLGVTRRVRSVPKPVYVQRRALTTGRSSDAQAFLLREGKILATLAVVGAIGGMTYYYTQRKSLPSQVYAGIATAEEHMESGRYGDAVEELKKTKAVVENGQFSAESSEYVLFLMGQCYNHLEEYSLAKQSFRSAIALLSKEPKQRASNKRRRVLMSAHNGLGLALHRLGQSDKAETCYLKALAVCSSPEQLGELVEEVSKVTSLSSFAESNADMNMAVTGLREEERFAGLSVFAVEIAGTLNNLGAAYAESGKVEAAEGVYLRCLAFLAVFGLSGSTYAEHCRDVLHAIRVSGTRSG